MFDGLKIKCNNTPTWEQGGRLHFVLSVVEQTGEILNIKEAKHNGLTFRIVKRGGVETYLCLGSIHRYKNGGGLNNDSFTYSDVARVLEELSRDFGVDLHKTKILHLEFGVNLTLNFKPQRIINSAISHRNTPFVALSRRCVDYGVICSHEDYEIKLYDKAYRQKTKQGYVLRVELRTRRMRLLSNCGVNCLADLLRVECWERLKQLFVDKLRSVVFVDIEGARRAPLTESERNFITMVSNRFYWANLNKKSAYRVRLKFARLIQKYGLSDIAKLLSVAVANEIDNLLQNKVSEKNALKIFVGTNSHLIYMLENVPKGDVLNKNKSCHSICKNGMATATNKFNIKTMRKNNKKPKYFIITYGGKTAKESVLLEKWEINTTSYWAKRVVEVKNMQTNSVIKEKRAIDWVKAVSKANNARQKKRQRKENLTMFWARARELARVPLASLDSVACGLGISRARLSWLMRGCPISLRHELARARASRVWNGYINSHAAKEIAKAENITYSRTLQIINKCNKKSAHASTIRPLALAGLTQKEIAARLGVTRQTVSRWIKRGGLASVRSDSLNSTHASTIRPLVLAGLTQKEIAARLGVTRQTVSRWIKRGGLASVRSDSLNSTHASTIRPLALAGLTQKEIVAV